MEEEYGLNEVESLCMNCHENGMTKLLPMVIPYFRQIVICAFECPHCDYSTNEVMPASTIQEQGIHYTLEAKTPKDLNRQLIKSNTAQICIPSLDFYIPPQTQKGVVNTIEGFLTAAADSLQSLQPQRMMADPDTARQIQTVIDKLRELAEGGEPFTLELRDPSGNSFIENPHAPHMDPLLRLDYFAQTKADLIALGLAEGDEEEGENCENAEKGGNGTEKKSQKNAPKMKVAPHLFPNLETFMDVTSKAGVIPGTCESCHAPNELRMCVTEIPYFKEIVLLVSSCDSCGFRDAEVKPGGAIEPKGMRITLKVTSPEDLARDLLKSDSAGIEIPELELEMLSGTLGGKYTTLEGILGDIRDSLKNSHAFGLGDSSVSSELRDWMVQFEELSACKGDKPFTFVLDDPQGNAYIYNPFAPEKDPNMTIQYYTRTAEQDEELGLLDMKTEDYE